MAASDSRVAVYSGVFDPVHYGHLDMISRGSQLFDKLIVGVGINPDKSPIFTPAERVSLLQDVCKPYANVEIRPFDGLTVHFVRSCGTRIMLRGLRTVSDMEYEFSMTLTNHALDQEIETVFLMASNVHSHVSSTLIKQIATFNGDIGKFVPPPIRDALMARVKSRGR